MADGAGRRATSLAAVMFTDVVGSTALRSRLGDNAADDLRRRHDQALGSRVDDHGGTLVKGVGDGIMATFDGAAEAVSCAVDVLAEIRRLRESRAELADLAVRIGVSLGDVAWDDGDCFGTPVVEAARLCDAAGGDQVIVSDVVRSLASPRVELAFSSLGTLELKGLSAPLAASEVIVPDLAEGAGIPFPIALVPDSRLTFVGRRAELKAIDSAWREAVEGELRMVLLGGDPGIGKTRFVSEAARQLYDEQAVVLFGRCDEEASIPYQPFVEAIGSFIAAAGDDDLSAAVTPLSGELVRLVPRLASRITGLAEPLAAEPETMRHRLFEAIAEFVSELSQRRPVVLILDDLHWAGKPSLLLLRHLMRSPLPMRMLVIAPYRETDLARTHALSAMMADFETEAGVTRVALSGLSSDEVAELMESAAGHDLEADGLDLAQLLHTETGGNVFFVREILLHLVESEALVQQDGRWVPRRSLEEIGLPQGVRDVIGRRLSRLPALTDDVLGVASAIGQEFDLGLLAAGCDRSLDEVLQGLEAAEEAAIVAPVGGRTDRYKFFHALLRSTRYEELPTTTRLRIHRRLARSLIDAGSENLTALARHLSESAALGDADLALDYARRAAAAAVEASAFEEAVDHHRQALRVLDLVDEGDSRQRCELLRVLAETLMCAGDPAFREAVFDAAAMAERLGDPVARAQAVQVYANGFLHDVGLPTTAEEELFASAVAGLADEHPRLKARLLSGVGQFYVGTFVTEEAQKGPPLMVEARRIAVELGDPDFADEIEARTVFGEITIGHEHGRLAAIERILERVEPEHRLLCLNTRAVLSAVVGDRARFNDSIRENSALSAELKQNRFAFSAEMFRALSALVDGDLLEAERLATAGAALGAAAGVGDSRIMMYVSPFFSSTRELMGRCEEMIPPTELVVEQQPDIGGWQAYLAFLHARTGQFDQARELFEPVAADDFRRTIDIPLFMYGAMALLAEVIVELGDAEAARTMHRLLSPYAGLHAVTGNTYVGTNDRTLGMAAMTFGDLDLAAAHFETSDGMSDDIGNPTWQARARHRWAQVLLARGASGDTADARELLEAARVAAERHGMVDLVTTTSDLLKQTAVR